MSGENPKLQEDGSIHAYPFIGEDTNEDGFVDAVPLCGYDDAGNAVPIKVNENGEVKMEQTGSNMALSATPETGTKTITSTAAEIFAGTSRKSERSMMYIRNTHDSIAIRIGASDITDIKGRRILPNSEEKIEFDPQSDVPLYAISEFGDIEVEVFEA